MFCTQSSLLSGLLLQAPLYSDKAKLCPESRFVIGYDTAIRLIMPKYYGGHTAMLLDLNGIKHLGCKFLVAGRVGEDGKFLTMDDIQFPQEVVDMVCLRTPSKFDVCLSIQTAIHFFFSFTHDRVSTLDTQVWCDSRPSSQWCSVLSIVEGEVLPIAITCAACLPLQGVDFPMTHLKLLTTQFLQIVRTVWNLHFIDDKKLTMLSFST